MFVATGAHPRCVFLHSYRPIAQHAARERHAHEAYARRRFGHNELDDPSTTLPLTYARLAAHPPVKAQYAAQLLADGVVTGEETAAWAAELEREFSRGAPPPPHCTTPSANPPAPQSPQPNP